jgi:hypothetical protein
VVEGGLEVEEKVEVNLEEEVVEGGLEVEEKHLKVIEKHLEEEHLKYLERKKTNRISV